MATRKSGSRKPVHDVVKEAMPGWSVVRVSSGAGADKDAVTSDAIPPAADTVMPSLETLKKKYLGSTSRDATASDAVPAAPIDSDTQTVTVESKGMKKTVGVSDDGKVLWRQG